MSSVNIKIAIAGIGTVGGGLLELIKKFKSSDIKINITAVATRRKQKFHVVIKCYVSYIELGFCMQGRTYLVNIDIVISK